MATDSISKDVRDAVIKSLIFTLLISEMLFNYFYFIGNGAVSIILSVILISASFLIISVCFSPWVAALTSLSSLVVLAFINSWFFSTETFLGLRSISCAIKYHVKFNGRLFVDSFPSTNVKFY